MSEPADPAAAAAERPAPVERRPYAPPAVTYCESLDVRVNLASACGKVSGSDAICDASPGS